MEDFKIWRLRKGVPKPSTSEDPAKLLRIRISAWNCWKSEKTVRSAFLLHAEPYWLTAVVFVDQSEDVWLLVTIRKLR